MAQTGYTPILIYSSSTVSQAPSAGNLTNSTLGSELAINITDGKLFYKDNANAVQVIAWKTTPTTAGGTGLTSYTAGDMLYYATGTALTKLAIGASGRWLGSSGTAPQWNSPAALTKTDDTNVTLTLGGSASTALLNAASLTLGWTGQLATSRGGTGLASFTSGGILYASSTSALTTGTALQFNGKIEGIGAAPSTWFTTYNGLQINTVGGITSNTDFFAFSDNVLVNASGNETFLTNGFATRYRQIASNGKHEWYSTAASGTAGNAATLALLLDLSPSSGDLGLKTGNLIQGTAAKGINFTANTPAAGMTSQLLNWYEEGTWTPNQGSGLTVVGAFSSVGRYTRTGNVVVVNFSFTGATSVAVNAGGNLCTNLPYTVNANVSCSGVMARAGLASGGTCAVEANTKNAWATSTIAATGTLSCSVTYII